MSNSTTSPFVSHLWNETEVRDLDAVDRDPSRINFEPAKRSRLLRRYYLAEPAEAAA